MAAGRRRVAVSSLLFTSLLVIALALSRRKTLVVLLSTLGFGVMDRMLPSAWALCLDVGASWAGVVTGMMNTAGRLGGFVCTVLFGYIVRRRGAPSGPGAAAASGQVVAEQPATTVGQDRRLADQAHAVLIGCCWRTVT